MCKYCEQNEYIQSYIFKNKYRTGDLTTRLHQYIIDNKLHTTISSSFVSDSDRYYESQGLDISSPHIYQNKNVEINYCPFCGRKL